MLKAVTRQASAVDAKVRALNADPSTKHPVSTAYYFDHFATPADIAVMVTEEDFMGAHQELIPSVSAGELLHYERVRATFEGVPKDKGQAASLTAPGLSGQQQQRSVSTGSRSGAGKAPARGGKGKGKAIALTSDDEFDDDDNGEGMDQEGNLETNGRDKGKGKAVMGFQDGTASDDDGLY